MLRSRCWLAAFAVLLAAAPARAQRTGGDETSAPIPRAGVHMGAQLRVQPEPVACLLAGWFPVLRARVESPVEIEKARLRFRPESYALWYEVPLRPEAEAFVAVLPKPRPAARRVHYYFEVLINGARARTTEQIASVVEDRAQCKGKVAPALEMASVPVVVPRGAPAVPPVPPGFVPAGAVAAEMGRAERSAKEPLVLLGVVGALAGGVIAIPNQGTPVPQHDATPPPPQEVVWLDSNPPPGSTLSLGMGATLIVRLTVQPRRRIGPGQIRVVLYRSTDGPGNPCAVVSGEHGGFEPGAPRQVTVGGPLMQARACQPSNRLRIQVQEGGREVLTSLEYSPSFILVP